MGGDVHRTYEIRRPVYGFVKLSDWEWHIISQPAYQRLRRIRQLAWTDYVYPGAMHTRFEHSLGVMHMATMLYNGIAERSRHILKSQLGYNSNGIERHLVLVRLAALLHDVGHGPFSHAAEELFPMQAEKATERYKHEHYSAAIVRRHFSDVIKTIRSIPTMGFRQMTSQTFWRARQRLETPFFGVILFPDSSMPIVWITCPQLPTFRRRVRALRLAATREHDCRNTRDRRRDARIGIEEGGWHAAEGLIIARYFMFTQVYFHKTRVILDFHLQGTLADVLPEHHFPKPIGDELDQYLQWDDWRVLGLLASGNGGEDGKRLSKRDHFREVAHTPEVPSTKDLERLDKWRDGLAELLAAEIRSREVLVQDRTSGCSDLDGDTETAS